jgi:predicted  nucleic acid-binding Zn-ribbon protein
MDVKALHELQSIDTAIDQGRHAQATLPERVRHDDARARLGSLRAKIGDVRREQSAFESELAAIERRAAELGNHKSRLEKQLKTVIAPREAEALQHEMTAIDVERGEGDDRGLELLESSARADADLSELMVRESEALALEADAARQLEAALIASRAILEDLERQRVDLVSRIAPSDVRDYERLRASHGGVAVAEIRHGVCGGCHMDISPSELDAIRRLSADAVAECPNCSRLLLR